ncbi:MAG: SRPBCC family protein [Flavobacterium sp.]
MAFYQLNMVQKIPATIDEVWDFISSPTNLKKITPPHMGFEITNTINEEKMYPGMIITYKVSPLLSIKIDWMTEITQVDEKKYFVDEQRIGPYKLWHHQHKIEPITNGVLMTDIVTYQPPFGILGIIAQKLIIKNQLKEIFDFRYKALEIYFGKFQE